METKPSTSTLERTARVVIPALSLIVITVAQLYGTRPRLSWAVIVLAVAFTTLTYFSTLKDRLAKWKSLWDDRRRAKRAFPELQEFVRRFAPFVNRQTNDTLHYIVESDIWQGRPALRADCQLPNVDIWVYQRLYFSERLNRQPKTMKELRPALMEFHYLVSSYNAFCVAPILELLPANVRALITPPVLAKLNLFQQKFGSFLQDYQLFAERLSDSRPVLKGIPSNFNMPKPMV
jgi:hypothetical protein